MENKSLNQIAKVIKKAYHNDIEKRHSFKFKVFGKLKKYGQKTKFYLKKHPWSSLALKVFLPILFMAMWVMVAAYFNKYAVYSNNCDLLRAQVGVEIKRRLDMVPNLVNCVNRYTSHEKDIMKHVSDARRSISGSNSIAQKIAAAKVMQGALSRLLAIVERYPDLKAADPVQTLIKEVSNTENRIADWRQKYNESAREFNNLYSTFPSNILGYCFGIRQPMAYIDTDEDLLRVAMIKFNKAQDGD